MATLEYDYESLAPAEAQPDDAGKWPYLLEALTSFRSKNQDTHDVIERPIAVLELTSGLREELGLSEASMAYDVAARRPLTQVLALEWSAWETLWFYSGRQFLKGGADIPTGEHQSREKLFEEIDLYAKMGRHDTSAYANLLDSLYLARLVVREPSGLPAIEKGVDRVALAQLLNVHKLVGALQRSGFSRTRRATARERAAGISAVIPFGAKGANHLDIKVQPGFKNAPNIITQQFNKRLLVDIPYISSDDPFEMKDEDREIATGAVKEMRAKILGLKVIESANA